MHFYSIHVIAEYNLSGSEIICRQIIVICCLATLFLNGWRHTKKRLVWQPNEDLVIKTMTSKPFHCNM